MKILFICTGNTCRSPMAEGLFRELLLQNGLADEMMCQSAGLSAVGGEPASAGAMAVCREIGIDLSEHRARRLTPGEIPVWDVFFTMSKTHAYILEQGGVPPEKIYVPSYIEDPFGQSTQVYRQCRDKLKGELELFFEKLTTWREKCI